MILPVDGRSLGPKGPPRAQPLEPGCEGGGIQGFLRPPSIRSRADFPGSDPNAVERAIQGS